MHYTITTLSRYTEDIAMQLGKLAPQLMSSADGSAIDEQLLRDIIASPHHDQFIALTQEGNVIGAAGMSMVLDGLSGRIAELQGLVVDSSYRGHGVADALWDAICQWAVAHDAHKLEFTSNAKRTAAHRFYAKHGATMRETDVFVVSADTLRGIVKNSL